AGGRGQVVPQHGGPARDRHPRRNREVARDLRSLEVANPPASLVGQRAAPQVERRRLDLSLAVWIVAAAALLFMVVVPMLWLFVASVQIDRTGELSLGNYVQLFTRPIYLQPILNSFLLATSVALLAVSVGTVLAWAVSRTDMPARGLIRALVFAAFVTPSFL